MNIRCPSCQTVFRVDPARVPPGGIRARCSRCGETFQIRRPEESTAPRAAEPVAAPKPAAVAQPAAVAEPAAPPAPPTLQAAPPPPPPAPPAPAAAAPAAAAGTPHMFGSRDPNVRAQRIARALVSDIIAYHPKRWETAREGGTLRGEFRDEIMKSWEEYVAQVGLELAKSTPHFRAALNDILAKGQQVF